ncbi:AfsR/SARP family transcriptional regulator [Actinophytocola sp.]|uniref:AfsR/SARP family transcriptional regulator n=1 Tax=Actinophytocola sp. TaxID=1872138 RepID=UPI003D6C68A4
MRDTEPALRFTVLGPLEVHHDGAPVALGRPQRRALLAILLLRANHPLSTAELVRRLWGDQPPATARAQVHALVSALRAVLPGGDRLLCTEDTGYLLRIEPDQLDLLRFSHELDRAQGAATAADMDAAARAYRAATGLWRGTPFGDIDAAFVPQARRELAQRYVGALEELLELDLARGAHADVVGAATAALADHPGRERLHRLLMLALHRGGRAAEAIAVYRDARQAMGGASPELDRLAQRILSADPALDGSPAESTDPHRLPPPTSSADDTVDGAALDRALTRGTSIVVVRGTGASGLAVRWAHAAAGRFPDGRLYADLRATEDRAPADPAAILAGFLHTLGAGPDLPSNVDERAALFRSLVHGRRVLIVLDRAEDTTQVRPLLPGAASCAVVVTSRGGLGGLVARYGAARIEVGDDRT